MPATAVRRMNEFNKDMVNIKLLLIPFVQLILRAVGFLHDAVRGRPSARHRARPRFSRPIALMPSPASRPIASDPALRPCLLFAAPNVRELLMRHADEPGFKIVNVYKAPPPSRPPLPSPRIAPSRP